MMDKTRNNSEFEACKVSSLLQKLYCDSTLSSQKRITTGYKYMDRLIDGLPSGLVIIAGKTSMGRTSLALNMAYRQSVFAKIPVAIFSQRFTERIYLDRLQALATNAPVEKVRWDFTDIKDKEAIKKLFEAPLYLWVRKYINYKAILERIEAVVNEKHVSVVYLNDFQSIVADTMNPIMPVDSMVDKYAVLSYELRKLAHKLGITIIAISSVVSDSNDTDSETFHHGVVCDTHWPSLDDLDSEELVNSANIVLMVHRPEFYKYWPFYYSSNVRNIMFVSAAKNVSGPSGTIALHFDHDSLSLSQPNLTEEEFHKLESDIMIPLPNAGDDPDDLVPEYEGQEKEEIKAWHKAQNLIMEMSYESDEIKMLVEKLGLEPD